MRCNSKYPSRQLIKQALSYLFTMPDFASDIEAFGSEIEAFGRSRSRSRSHSRRARPASKKSKQRRSGSKSPRKHHKKAARRSRSKSPVRRSSRGGRREEFAAAGALAAPDLNVSFGDVEEFKMEPFAAFPAPSSGVEGFRSTSARSRAHSRSRSRSRSPKRSARKLSRLNILVKETCRKLRAMGQPCNVKCALEKIYAEGLYHCDKTNKPLRRPVGSRTSRSRSHSRSRREE